MVNNSFILDFLTRFSHSDENTCAFALYDGTQVSDISYHHFCKDILTVAGFFRAQGIQGKHIALIAPDSYQWLVTFFGIMASSNVAVLLNPSLPGDILSWQCEKADVSYLCSEAESLSQMTWNPGLPQLPFEAMADAQPLTLSDIPACDGDQTIMLMFTSGTTGKSKAVELTSENLLVSCANIEGMYDGPTMDRVYPAIPLFHIGALRYVLASLQRLKTICMGRGPRYMLMDLPMLNPTGGVFVPAILESISKVLKRCKTDADRAKYIGSNMKRFSFGGAVLKPAVAQFYLDQGFILEVIFGMTETACDGMSYRLDLDHMNSLGKLCGNMEAKLENNELLLKCGSIMKSYYKDPEETAKVKVNGWMHTGDLARVDADGYYYLTGRKKNVIILANGENVNPEEIEATLVQCDAVQECMVYGEVKGICADIYTTEPDTVAAFVKAYNESTPAYRQVYKVNYMDQPLEKTPSGKIKRKENKYV